MQISHFDLSVNALNTELNTICHLLALLGAHHIFHVSRIRVKHQAKHTDMQYNMHAYIYTRRANTDSGKRQEWK
jgi:hypothetical protein